MWLPRQPASHCVVAASAENDVRDPSVAFPPALVGPGESPGRPRFGLLVTGFPPADGSHTHGMALVRYLPDLVSRNWHSLAACRPCVEGGGRGGRRQRAAIAHANHLVSAVYSIPPPPGGGIGISGAADHLHDDGRASFILACQRIEDGRCCCVWHYPSPWRTKDDGPVKRISVGEYLCSVG